MRRGGGMSAALNCTEYYGQVYAHKIHQKYLSHFSIQYYFTDINFKSNIHQLKLNIHIYNQFI